jgi:acetyl esterase/lipase
MKFTSCLLFVLAALVSVPRSLVAESSVPPGVKVLRNIEYVPGGGSSRSMDLYLPEHAAGPVPPIIYIHGGDWSGGSKEGGPGMHLPGIGFAVAKINYRLSSQAIFPAQIEDCKAAVRFLRAHAAEYHLDPNHIGVWGMSAGGHLAALLGTSGGGEARVQAVCDFFGPMTFIGAPPEIQARMDSPSSGVYKLLGGPPSKKPDLAKMASPITYVNGGSAPFLIVHGDRDDVVPLQQSQLLQAKLKSSGVLATLFVVPGAGHATGFDSPEVAHMIGGFFTRHLHPPGR